jgi:HAD superfamily hydrolase (TIGR01509 family)
VIAQGRRPDLVCFDLGGTLISPWPSWTDVYLGVCAEQGVAVPRERLEAGLQAALAGGSLDEEGPFEASAAASFARIRRFDAAIMAAAGVPHVPAAFYRALAARFAAAASWQVFPDVGPALHRLRAAGLRLAVISNWVWEAPRLIRALGLADWFETVVISDRVGYNKPHPAIFRAALEASGVAPGRAVHVGDSYLKDVVGATAVGMRAILLVRDEMPAAAVPPAGGAPVVVVSDLFGVAEQIGLG